MTVLNVTDHAISRLTGPKFDLVAKMGGGSVILSTGHRVVCSNLAVVTVLPRGAKCLARPGYAGRD